MNQQISQHAHINVKCLSSTGKVNLHLLAAVKERRAVTAVWAKQNKKNNPKTLNDTLLRFHNGARHSINANKHSWLSLDIAQFSRLSHANVSDCECSSVGVFNVPAVKTSSVNRQPSTICFFMVWLCLTRSLPPLPSSETTLKLRPYF